MHKIIANNFEIDLSTTSISIQEENFWFSDTFFTKYSFPFSLELTDENKLAFEDLLDFRNIENTVEFNVTYVFNDIKEVGILTVETILDTINCTLKYGIDEFPGFSKKLNEIGLQKATTTDIYAHAETIITQTWPAVNYNFPQIHTDKIDTEDETWLAFQKIINNYKNGDFVINEVVNSVPQNRNLMQPLPYLAHILTQGFLNEGYILKGDITTDTVFKKMLLYINTDYHKILDQVDIDVNIMGSDKISASGNEAKFLKTIALPQKGRYQISGTINLNMRWHDWTEARITYRGKTLWYVSDYGRHHHSGYTYTFDVDVVFDTINDSSVHELIFTSSNFLDDNSQVASFTVSSLFFYDDLGNSISNIVNNNDIELNRVVPDITFGDFVSIIRNWFNLDIQVQGKEVWLNYIENQINYDNAFSLEKFEVVPEKQYNRGISFILKFAEANDAKNNHDEVFFNADGYKNKNIVKNDKTNEILINAFPLLNSYRNEVQTAYAIDDDKDKIYVVMYDGLNSNSLNLTLDPGPMLLPQIIENRYKKWLSFRINALNLKWTFLSYIEDLNGLSVRSKIFAFGRYMILKSISKQQVAKDLFQVEIDSYTMQ